MSTLMLAASDPPRSHSAARVQLFHPKEFKSDAHRYRWIVAEFERRVIASPGVNKGQLARDVAAAGFEITITDLLSKSRVASLAIPRQKIACVIRLLAHVSLPKVAKLVGYSTHSSAAEACDKWGDDMAFALGLPLKGGAQ